MTMRETIARAIEETMLACGALKRDSQIDWTRGPALVAADAVLDAMIEAGPTEAMLTKGTRVGSDAFTKFCVRGLWTDLLTAAKEER